MQRIHVYLKVVIEVDDDERPERLTVELQRVLKRVHGVRAVELTNSTIEPFDAPKEKG